MKTFLVLIPLFGLAACVTRGFNTDSGDEVQRLGTENSIADDGRRTTGDKLGLGPKEIALTLDDGPVAGSLEIAQWLSARSIPVTYFMIGANAKANMDTAKKIAALPHVVIANHSMDHRRKFNDVACIACDGAQYAIHEVMEADKVLAPLYQINSPKFYFFRAPGGNFFRQGNSAEIAELAEVNRAASKYVGPVRWDVDGDVNPGSDGGCSNSDASGCRDIYMRQIRALGNAGIVVLAHDVHAKSRDMIKMLVADLKAEGYKFVALDKSPNTVAAVGQVSVNASNQEFGTTAFSSARKGPRQYAYEVKAPGAARIEVWIDRKTDAPLFAGAGDVLRASYTFTSTGSRFFTIKGFAADGKLIAQAMRQSRVDP